jgi:hypothetical protein
MSEDEITAYNEAKNKVIAMSDFYIKDIPGPEEDYDDPLQVTKTYVPTHHREYVDIIDHNDDYSHQYYMCVNKQPKHYSIKKSMPLKRFKFAIDLASWVKQQGKIDDFKEWIRIPREKFRCLRTRLGYMFQPKDMEFKSILVKNLAPQTTGFQLREIFAQYGYVRDVYIPYNRLKSEPRNYGFIEIHFTTSYDQVIDEFSQFSVLNGQSIKIQQAIMGRSSAEQMKARDDPV